MSDKARPNWVKVDEERSVGLKRKFNKLKIRIYKLEQILVVLLVLKNHTD